MPSLHPPSRPKREPTMSTSERVDFIEEDEVPLGNVEAVICLSLHCACSVCGATLYEICVECRQRQYE